MFSSLDKLEYAVEWRVINAADYGFPQKRRRVLVIKSTSVYTELKEIGLFEWTLNNGIFQSGGLKAEINPKSLEERISSLLKSTSSKKVSRTKSYLTRHWTILNLTWAHRKVNRRRLIKQELS